MMKEIWAMEKDQKICAIDIDGVLSDYPKCWVDYINLETGKTFKNLTEAKANLSYQEYKKIKHSYRTRGYKRSLPTMPHASDFVHELSKNGYRIVLLTARPFRQYRNLYADTAEWLTKNRIFPDFIIWEKEKHWEVLKQFPYMNFMVEDNAEIANQVARLGYKVYVLDNEYNQQPLEKNVSRVKDLMEIIKNEVF